MPEVVTLLHPQPNFRAVAAEFAEPYRHLRSDGRLTRDNPMQGLAGNPEPLGRVAYRQIERGQHVLAQNLTRMGRWSYDPLAVHEIFAHFKKYQINLIGGGPARKPE